MIFQYMSHASDLKTASNTLVLVHSGWLLI